MEKKIEDAFNQIHAEEELKDRTKVCLSAQLLINNMKKSRRQDRRTGGLRYAAAGAALMIFIALGIFNPSVDAQASYIRLEGDISVGLSLDDDDTVIEVHGLNEQGEQLLKDINLEGLSYREAVDCIMDSKQKLTGQTSTTPTSVTVEGEDQEKCHRLQAEVTKQCSSHEKKHNSGRNAANSVTESDTNAAMNSDTGRHSSNTRNKKSEKHGAERNGHGSSAHHSRKKSSQ